MNFVLLFGPVPCNLHGYEKNNPKTTKTVYPIICQIVNVIPHQLLIAANIERISQSGMAAAP